MAVELRADNTLGLFDLQRDGLGGCCMGAARWPHVVALAADRWRGRKYKLWPVADRQVARVWSARGLQAASGDHVPTLASSFGKLTIQPLFLARPAGTPSSAHRGRTRPLPPPGEPPSARAAPGGTASMAPRSASAGRGRPYRLWETVLLGRTAGWGLGGWYVRAKWGRFGGESCVKQLCAGG